MDNAESPGGLHAGAARPRIAALDVLRGVAVLGILFINISLFGLPSGANAVLGDRAAVQLLDFSVWAFNELFVEGTMRGLFSMLFGASMLLMTGAALAHATSASAPPGALDLYARRSLWLVAFGLVHAYVLLWPHDILYAYGVLGLVLLPFRLLDARKLALAGLLMLASAALISGLDEPPAQTGSSFFRLTDQESDPVRFSGLPDGLEDITPPEAEIRTTAAQARIRDAIDSRRSGYRENFEEMASETASLQSEGLYRTNVFDIGGMMLIGMALLKAGVLTGSRSRRFYWLMLAVGYGLGLVVNSVELWASVVLPQGSQKIIYWSEVTYDLGRLPTVFGHIAVVMLLMRLKLFEGAARLLSAAGRLALTNYVMQTVICNSLFLGVGFGLYGALSLHQLMIVAVLISAFQVFFSVLWLRRYRLGPLEWALRSLVRWSPQPLRRWAPGDAARVPSPAGVSRSP